MSVKLIDTNVPVDISIKDSRIPSKQLLDEAKHNLRCVDFKDLTLDLFLQSVRDTTSRSLTHSPTHYHSLTHKSQGRTIATRGQ